MIVKYFKDTDTLYIELRANGIHETREVDENTFMDLDRDGRLCALTIEHASQCADIPSIRFEEVAA